MDDIEETREEKLNWNPQWYAPLRVLARQIITSHNVTLYDVDELVTIAWLKCASRFDESEGPDIIFKHRKNISGKMLYAAFGYTRKAYNADCSVKRVGMIFNCPDGHEVMSSISSSVCNAIIDPHDYINGVDTVDLIHELTRRLDDLSAKILLLMLKNYTVEEMENELRTSNVRVRYSIDVIRGAMLRLLGECE